MKQVLGRRKTSAFRRREALSSAAALFAVGLIVFASARVVADEGGVGFWFPGQFGSLAAVPQVPGWAVGIINVYENVSASGNVAAAREVTLGNLHPNVNVNLNVNIGARPDLVLVAPTYAFATPVLGGQLALTMAGAGGRSSGDLNGTLTVSALGMTATRQGAISDARYGFTDLYPEAR